jgi:hypothetical protein
MLWDVAAAAQLLSIQVSVLNIFKIKFQDYTVYTVKDITRSSIVIYCSYYIGNGTINTGFDNVRPGQLAFFTI